MVNKTLNFFETDVWQNDSSSSEWSDDFMFDANGTSLEEHRRRNVHNDSIVITTKQILTLIVPYTVIFTLSIIGNILVFLTIVLNKNMRTNTNAFLLNLAISNFLLGVFCMPFTLIGMLLRQFIFGEFLCRVVPFLQAVSVCVSSWTLVAVSLERFYAICHPLESRAFRQSWSHTYKVLGGIWFFAVVLMSPIIIVSKLIPMTPGRYKCREKWPSENYLVGFTITLDVLLFVIPLAVLMSTFIKIAIVLLRNFKSEPSSAVGRKANIGHRAITDISESIGQDVGSNKTDDQLRSETINRSANEYIESRQMRVIRVLFVVVMEFFICWTPLHTINTVAMYYPHFIYVTMGYDWLTSLQLLAFSSACTNPVTYAFMHSRFRKSFKSLFKFNGSRNGQVSRFKCSTFNRKDTSVTLLKESKRIDADGFALNKRSKSFTELRV